MRRTDWLCLASVLFVAVWGGCATSGGNGGGGGNDNVADNDNVDNDNEGGEEEEGFEADLSGDNEVPAITSNVTGTAAFEAYADRIEYALTVMGDATVEISAAHIHLGDAATNGPIVAFLTPGDFTPMSAGTLNVTGTIEADDLAGMSLSDLADAMRDGGAYVNVHSVGNPAGEVRGQIGPE